MRHFKIIILLLFVYFIISQHLRAQSECSDVISHGAGFTTSIESVTYDSLNQFGDAVHTIVIRVENDGCTDPECKALNQYSVEAMAGTYSDITHASIAGDITYGGINMGPGLGGVPFDGFRISNINGIGNGEAGVFTITYTLTGGLQRQKMQIKASNYESIVEFQLEDFQNVLNCYAISNILPYYAPPDSGKIQNSLIGAELTSLYETYLNTDSASSNDIFQIVNQSNVVIEVFAVDGKFDELLALLQSGSYGLTDVTAHPVELRITGVYPILNLLLINDLPLLVNYARPVYPGAPQSGIVNTQGDTAMLSFVARNGFDVSGENIKIGVMSDSYNTKSNGTAANDDVLREDLPGTGNLTNSIPVDVLLDYPYGVASDEGRAMLQIIHDVAPKAELAFRTGLISPVDFANGIHELQQAGCDIIVDDITYISEPFLRDGVVAQAVNDVVDLGVVYFTAAGNFGNKSFESPFVAGSVPQGLNGPAHNFAGPGNEDIYQSITVTEGTYTIVLQWDDGLGNELTGTDLDIYLANDDGSRLFGFNRENIGGSAIEVLPFKVLDTAHTNIVIVNNAGPDPVNMKYVVFRGEITFNEYFDASVSTIVGQANAEKAITVAAVLYSNTPAYGVYPPTVASFSSVGGTIIDGSDRNKPDITAPNGVNTTVDLGGPNFDNDPFPNFFGTSASAPHVAGVAALLLQAKAKFYDPGETLSPVEIKDILQATAVDMESPGFDPLTGAGLVNATDALLTLASPSPLITDIVYDTTLNPGEDTISLTVIGQYLTGGSQIYFNGLLLEGSSTVSVDMVTGTIPPFDERYPAIQVYNPPNTQTNGTDGGVSNPLYFSTKPTIVVNIADASKKYAEVLPDFDALYSVESVNGTYSLNDFGLSELEIARVLSISLITVANDTSNVGLWEIKPSMEDPLNPLSNTLPTDPIDTNLLYNFDFDLINGLLSIDKLDLTIIPKDTTIIYGDTLYGFDYYYIYNNDTIDPANNVLISEPVNQAVLNALRQSHATALVNAVATVRATALVNGAGEPLLDSAALANTSFFISNAVVSQRATALVNGTLLGALELLNAIGASSATALVNAIATVRATALVNGQASVMAYGTATALVNYGALVNAAGLGTSSATALVNSENINDNTNSGAVIILGEGDILILSGDSIGDVAISSINVITGNTVGEHLIVPGAFISNNFDVSYGIGKITILPDTAVIIFDPASLAQDYDGNANPVTAYTTPDSLILTITYNGDSIAPILPGSYIVTATVVDSNYVGSITDTLIINPASASVSADLKFIYAGDSLPSFTATFSGFVIGEDSSIVDSLSFTLSPAFAGLAGTYDIIPYAEADNYLFTPLIGTLYVNPSGAGTKHIKTFLNCVEDLTTPDSLGHTMIAYFEYENKNASDVYIPIGEDNLLSAEGSFSGINQPEVFYAGGGSWAANFDGNKFTWTVASYKHNGHKTSVASQASSTSSKCNKSEPVEDEKNKELSDIKVYPNPVTHKVYIEFGSALAEDSEVFVYDVFGRIQDISLSGKSDKTMEINMSGVKAGIYLIKVRNGQNIELLRVVKH
ncbi:MAG: hypothetical protein DRJ15_08945 [Bacteroidetes bacterium]|nr:MAG: hypothetical protein DRJ15_08945 [Bacteroidota bacterium]